LEKNNENELPKDWELVKIQDLFLDPKQDIVDGPFGSNLKASEYVERGIPLLRLQNVERNQFVNKNIRYISKEKASQLKRHNFVNNDIVITKLGEPVGKACLVPEYLKNGIIVADIVRMRINHDHISKKYLTYLINSTRIMEQFAKYTKGTTRPRVNLKQIRDFMVPIPPLNEQKRIVAKIEELFSILDETERTIFAIKTKLKQLQESILIHQIPRIFVKFLKSTYFDISNFDSLRKQYEQKLPATWKWKEMWEICELITDGSHLTPPRLPSGKIMLSAKNVRNGFLNLDDVRYVSENDFKREIKRCFPQKNDILMVSVGATIGRAAIVRNEPPFMIVRSVALLRPLKEVNPAYVLKWIQNSYVQKIIKRMIHDTARGGLYLNKIKKIPILLPTQSDQEVLTEWHESMESNLEMLSKSTDYLLGMAYAFRSSILDSAFKGKLVLQDPNDEPASILLEKIRHKKNSTKRG
jgi:type I restriction enzyme, S subunit